MTIAAVVIPYRDRGRDPRRSANLAYVMGRWATTGLPVFVFDDGRGGDEQFNRSIAYNRAVDAVAADVFIFAESDMLIDGEQVRDAIKLAMDQSGLVMPFTQYRALTAQDAELVRAGEKNPSDCTPEFVMDGDSIGAINVVSRATLAAIGRYDPAFEGSWWDDKAMFRAFEICAGPTRWVEGPAWHLWHLPGYTGEHLTDEDRAATARNEARWERYQVAGTPDEIRALTMEGG